MGKNGSSSKTRKFVNVLKNNKLDTSKINVSSFAGNSSKFAKGFASDYMSRHKHPVNAALHIVGVPVAFYGFYSLLSGKGNISRGGLFIFLGYLLQYLGHKAQGNEVGEVTLAKAIFNKLKGLTCCNGEGN